MGRINVSVAGRPRPKHGGAAPWAQAIFDAVREMHPEPLRLHRGVVHLDLTFRLDIAHFNAADLDNLGKLVVDVLFRVKSTQRAANPRATGALFSADDRALVSLVLKKMVVKPEEAEGLDIQAAWTVGDV